MSSLFRPTPFACGMFFICEICFKLGIYTCHCFGKYYERVRELEFILYSPVKFNN